MSGQSSSKIFPALSRGIPPQLIENRPPPSPIPEHIRAPPGTPNSSLRNTDSDNDTNDEQPPNLRSVEDSSPSAIQNPGQRKPPKRNRGKKLKSNTQLMGIFHPTLILENSGSVARDHLASERTFLAYIRTSLLLASTGVALVQLFAVASANVAVSATLNHIHQFARPLGATLVIFGLVVLAMGIRRYFLVQKFLTEGKFPVTRFSLGAVSITTAIIIIIVFAVLVSARN